MYTKNLRFYNQKLVYSPTHEHFCVSRARRDEQIYGIKTIRVCLCIHSLYKVFDKYVLWCTLKLGSKSLFVEYYYCDDVVVNTAEKKSFKAKKLVMR